MTVEVPATIDTSPFPVIEDPQANMPSPETPKERKVTQNIETPHMKSSLHIAPSTGSGVVAAAVKVATLFLEKEASKAGKTAPDVPNVPITGTKGRDLGDTEYEKASKSQDIIDAKHTDEIEEDRENLTHFKTWGKPEARDRARKHPYFQSKSSRGILAVFETVSWLTFII